MRKTACSCYGCKGTAHNRLSTVVRTPAQVENRRRKTQRALAKKLRKPPSDVHKTEIEDRRMALVEFIACRACQIDPSASIAAVEQ